MYVEEATDNLSAIGYLNDTRTVEAIGSKASQHSICRPFLIIAYAGVLSKLESLLPSFLYLM